MISSTRNNRLNTPNNTAKYTVREIEREHENNYKQHMHEIMFMLQRFGYDVWGIA